MKLDPRIREVLYGVVFGNCTWMIQKNIRILRQHVRFTHEDRLHRGFRVIEGLRQDSTGGAK